MSGRGASRGRIGSATDEGFESFVCGLPRFAIARSVVSEVEGLPYQLAAGREVGQMSGRDHLDDDVPARRGFNRPGDDLDAQRIGSGLGQEGILDPTAAGVEAFEALAGEGAEVFE